MVLVSRTRRDSAKTYAFIRIYNIEKASGAEKLSRILFKKCFGGNLFSKGGKIDMNYTQR